MPDAESGEKISYFYCKGGCQGLWDCAISFELSASSMEM
jgi:hypothetical protein